jgi:sugar O-acyltransferase (sialic acid O-acetyltransferase NeuD family)
MTFIFGIGGNAKAIANILQDLNVPLTAYVVDNPNTDNFLGSEVISYSKFKMYRFESSCILSIGHNSSRKDVHRRLISESIGNISFPTVIHPTAYVSKNSSLGQGTILYPNVTVGPYSSISDFVHLNSNSIVEHDNNVSEFASLAPGSVTGGDVVIGKESAILMNASISNKVTIGNNVVIGANSFLKTSTGDNELWVGVPAQFKKNRPNSDPYM